MSGEAAEKTGKYAPQGEPAGRQGEVGQGRVHFHKGKQDHESCHHQLHRGHLHRAAQELIGHQGRQVGEPQEGRGAQESGQQSGKPEAQDDGFIGVPPQEGQFEEIVGQMHHPGKGDGHREGKKEGENREQEGSQAEAGEKGETGGKEGGHSGKKIYHDV